MILRLSLNKTNTKPNICSFVFCCFSLRRVVFVRHLFDKVQQNRYPFSSLPHIHISTDIILYKSCRMQTTWDTIFKHPYWAVNHKRQPMTNSSSFGLEFPRQNGIEWQRKITSSRHLIVLGRFHLVFVAWLICYYVLAAWYEHTRVSRGMLVFSHITVSRWW